MNSYPMLVAWQAFSNAIESSPAHRSLADVVPMAASLESGGLR